MNNPLLKPAALLAAALLCVPPAFTQVKTEPAKPAKPAAPTPPAPPVAPASPGFSAIAPVLAAPTPRKLVEVHIDGWPLREAIPWLHQLMKDAGQDPINILLAPGTHDLIVPEIKLRNVSAADALQIIAAVTECTVETMLSTDTPAASPAAMLPGMGGMPASRPASAIIGYMLRAKGKPAPQGIVYMGGPPPMPAGRSVPAASPAGRITRIYPLGAVSTATKFPDLEKTLREIFKADGVAENQVSLALHEKTNVLVVNAAEPVHALVEQLLTALNTNTSQADRQNTARDRAMGREELESAMRAKARLEHELTERDAQMRELQKELRKLQDAGQKPPSAK